MTTEFSTELAGLSPLPEGAPRPSRGLDLKRLIRLRGPLMVIVFLALAIPLMALAWFIVPPQYKATALIRFSAKPQYVMFQETGNNVNRAEYERFVETYANLIGDTPILSLVIQMPEVRALPILAESRDPIATLKSLLTVRMEPRSELVSVSCSAADQVTPLTIVRAVVGKFEEYITAQDKTRGGERRAALMREDEETQKDLDARQARIDMLQKSIGANVASSADALATETQSYHENLSRAQADLSTAETGIARIEQLITQIEALREKNKQQPGEPIFEMGVEVAASADPAVVTLRQQLATHDQQLAVLRDRYVETAPQIAVELKTRDAIAKQVVEAEQKARADALKAQLELQRSALETAKSAKLDAESRQTKFEQLLSQHMEKANQVSGVQAEIDRLEQNAEDMRERLKEVRDQIYQIDVESNAPASIEVAGDAFAPTDPDPGKRLQVMALALVFSAGMAAAIGLWRELADQRVRSAQDMLYVTDLPVLATIPHISVDRLPPGANPRRLTAEFPESTTANEFRRILTRIVYPPEGSAELKTCLVASPSRGDGKTSVACNLAISLAQAGRRVLLIDVSVRKPDIESSFDLIPGPGLSEIMIGSMAASEVTRPTPYPNLFILGPGEDGETLIGRLASREMVEFLEQAEEAFDHVILDTPPALLMSDAKLLAPVVDGVIMVVGEDASSSGMVRRCLREMNEIGANVIGIALNGVRPTRGGYLRDNLELFYAYSGEGQTAQAASPVLLSRHVAGEPADEPADEEEPTILLIDDDEERGTEGASSSGRKL